MIEDSFSQFLIFFSIMVFDFTQWWVDGRPGNEYFSIPHKISDLWTPLGVRRQCLLIISLKMKFETVCTLASKKCFFLDGYCNSFAKFILELIFSNIEELRRFSSFFGQEVNTNCYLRSSGQNFKCDKGEVLPKLVSPHSWPPNILQHHKYTAD